jgi:hypothetical protein
MGTCDKILRALTGGDRGLDAGLVFLFIAALFALAVLA